MSALSPHLILPLTLAELAAAPRWVAWQIELPPGRTKTTKVAYDPVKGGNAKAHDNKPETWGTRSQAEMRANMLQRPYDAGGIGLELGNLGDGRILAGIDLDTCRDAAGTFTQSALEVMERFASYTEISPSSHGAKILFLADPADLTALGHLLTNLGAKVFTRRGSDHPPSIEFYSGNRYFALMERHVAATPTEIRPVSKDTLQWLLQVAGPALSGKPAGAKSSRRVQEVKHQGSQECDPTGRDNSRSALGMRKGAQLRRKGKSYDQMAQEMRLDPEVAAWVVEKGNANGGRELRRIWDKAGEDAWKDGWQVNEADRPRSNLANAMRALRCAREMDALFARDMMLRTDMLLKPVPGSIVAPHSMGSRPVRDSDVTAVQEYLQKAGLTSVGKDTIHQAVELRASERAFHPVRDYLTGLRWAGTPGLDTWLCQNRGVEQTDYSKQIGRMFLIAMVARVFQPGCKADYMLVLEGAQGARKSTACAILAGDWFSDNLPDLRSGGKDVAQHLNGKWLIEVAEMSALDKAEAAALKAFITRTTERYRPSFGHKEVVKPRQCLFIGTTNKAAYLRDETGGRRFWPVRAGIINVDALTRAPDPLFAEALHAYRRREKWWPDAAFEAEHIRPQQEARYEEDAWEQAIAEFVSGKDKVTALQVAVHALSIDKPKLGTADQRRITAALTQVGWKRSNKRGAYGERYWRPSYMVH